MGSVYANIVNKIRNNNAPGPGSYTYPLKISDIEEADPYYFVIKDNGEIVSEGELPAMKLKLPDKYFDMAIKKFYRDKVTMTAYIEF